MTGAKLARGNKIVEDAKKIRWYIEHVEKQKQEDFLRDATMGDVLGDTLVEDYKLYLGKARGALLDKRASLEKEFDDL